MRILLRVKSPTPANSLALPPSLIRVTARPQRVLDFDCECRPLTFLGDINTKEITAMAWAWTDRPDDVTCYLLGDTDLPDMLRAFVEAYTQADLVTGHYIRGFDLPLINGALTEYFLPPLGDKLTHDTKLDAVRRHGMSNSQESWAAQLDCDHAKEQMDQIKWRKANRLTADGLAEARRRVCGDVTQHIELRAKMQRLGYLSAPVYWSCGAAVAEAYTP